MSAHNVLKRIKQANAVAQYADPGASGTIRPDRSPCFVNLTSAAAETRTLARPTAAGDIVFLNFKTDGGDITLTVTGGFNETGDTTIIFNQPGQLVGLVAGYDGTDYYWRIFASHTLNGSLATGAGTGITGGAGTVVKSSATQEGQLKKASIYIDLTGLDAVATDLDIIGTGTNPAYLGQLLAAEIGTIEAIRMTCLEVPAGASADIDLYSAVEATGKLDDLVTGLTETALISAGGNWTNGAVKAATLVPGAANSYLYLTNGAAAGAGTYTAGKFLIEVFGY